MTRRFPPCAESASPPRQHLHAFTMVELVLAIGIAAFVLMALLGLLAQATNATREADLRERIAMISGRQISSYQSKSFAVVMGNALASPAVPTSLPATEYFDYYGTPTTDAAKYYFRSVVTNVTPVGSPSSLAMLQLSITWPNPQFTSTNVSLFSIFNYE